MSWKNLLGRTANAIAAFVCFAATAYAQAPGTAKEEPPVFGNYGPGALFTLFWVATAAAVAIASRSSQRDDKPRKEYN